MLQPSLRRLSCRLLSVTAAGLLVVCASQGQDIPSNKPLPDPRQMKDRVLETERKSAKEKERYLCEVQTETDELDGSGKLKKHTTEESEQFYVNGQEIDHTLSKDGKPLNGDAAKKEQDRVNKQVRKYSDPKQVKKAQQEEDKQAELFLKALRYTNGRRDYRDGRAVVSYDLSGDPSFHPKSLEEKFAQALTGRISIDEESGELIDLRVSTDHDIKILGFVGTVKKGFQFHLTQKRQSDGVWIVDLVEGSGFGRALFLNRGVRFRASANHCRLYNVDATSTTGAPQK